MFGRDGVPKERVELLRNVPLFEGLSDKALKRLDAHVDDVEVLSGEALTFQGKYADQMFVVVTGTAEVTVDGEVVAEVGPGEVIGEVAILERRRRTASVRAKTPMRLLVMPPHEVGWLLDEPTLAARVRTQLAEHLERATPADDAT
jgi:cAMP-dependent protein kinase regulator